MVSTKTNAVKNFLYFALNFSSDFIQEIWKDEPSQIEHLQNKFNYRYNRDGAVGAMTGFFSELDWENQSKLIDWVNVNYRGFKEFHNDEPQHSKEEKSLYMENMTSKWRVRYKAIDLKWGTQKYRQAEMEFFQGGYAATGIDISYVTICMISGREIVKKD